MGLLGWCAGWVGDLGEVGQKNFITLWLLLTPWIISGGEESSDSD